MKSYNRIILLAGLVSLFLISCGKSPLDEKIDSKNLSLLVEKVKAENKLPLEEVGFLGDGIYRLGANVDTLKNFTLREIIESQRKYVHDNSLRALENRAVLTEINMNYVIKYIDLQAKDNDTVNMNVLIVEFINYSKNNFKSLQGHLQYYDMNNQLIKQFPVIYSNPIKAGQVIRVSQGYLHDPKSERDVIVREQKASLKALWQPEVLEFEDGRKIAIK